MPLPNKIPVFTGLTATMAVGVQPRSTILTSGLLNGQKAKTETVSNAARLSASRPGTTAGATTAAPTPTNATAQTSNGKSGSVGSAVQVIVRLRPLLPSESKELVCARISNGNTVEMDDHRNGPKSALSFAFDTCLDDAVTQEQVFGHVTPIVDKALHSGMNASIFAYGPTSSGKSFSMMGGSQPEARGIIPRAAQRILDQIATMEHCSVQMAFFEIYMEKIIDLLSGNRNELELREDVHHNIVIAKLQETTVSTYAEFEALFAKALTGRSVGETKLNEASSRSHSVLRFKIIKRVNDKTTEAKLYLIDLAGSEDNRKTDNSGERMKESGAINKSLFVLGKVIDALNKNDARIPYRDSKLTRLLQDSLGGNSAACMLTNIAPCGALYMDTLMCLNYASKSRSIVNKPVVNPPVVDAVPPAAAAALKRPMFAFKRSAENDDTAQQQLRKKTATDDNAVAATTKRAENASAAGRVVKGGSIVAPFGQSASVNGIARPVVGTGLKAPAVLVQERLPAKPQDCSLAAEHVIKARSFHADGNKHGALLHYRKALTLNPNQPDIEIIANALEHELEREDGVASSPVMASAPVTVLLSSIATESPIMQSAVARPSLMPPTAMNSSTGQGASEMSAPSVPETPATSSMDTNDVTAMGEPDEDYEDAGVTIDENDDEAFSPRSRVRSKRGAPSKPSKRGRRSIEGGDDENSAIARLPESEVVHRLNTGDLKVLMQLSGIGKRRAQTIALWRNERSQMFQQVRKLQR
ncbi:kinesin-like protein KIF22 [Capsaspora owczarzaki ATCC 30864]|uniref:Kinesin-like protein n=1 Tax=Capsaspora owczarzaki (strain ATCC 30864) TaxID=595528 RepID=A0A0D2WNX7_CAPO3|nr:kinesin-like protein KIF22 [Capsaspora owczarzaki ATCC 30864]